MVKTTDRLLWLDVDGYPLKSAHIECPTDLAAVEVARAHTSDFEVIEIWDGGRFIAVVGIRTKAARLDAPLHSPKAPAAAVAGDIQPARLRMFEKKGAHP